MFLEKKRHWITGQYHSFYYDSWPQWIESAPYTKPQWAEYKFIFWNIKATTDSKKEDDSHIVQLVYGTMDGQFIMKAIHIIVGAKDEWPIRQWLDEHGKL